jgi:hypothetical protein
MPRELMRRMCNLLRAHRYTITIPVTGKACKAMDEDLASVYGYTSTL